MSRLQPIFDIAELCSAKGLSEAILCPGSRCAPLVLAFVRHTKINTRTFSDERSAGFVALGFSQQKQKPALLLCTSGTAAYNFSPVVAEAFFSETPLIVITADRPAEWVAQHDGQTIHQENIFGRHVKKSFTLPQEYEHADSQWAINRMVNEAINLAQQEPKGPVHINAPFREPLYPEKGEAVTFSENVRVITNEQPVLTLSEEIKKQLSKEIASYTNILLVGGQHEPDAGLFSILETLSEKKNVPVLGDIISNLHSLKKNVRHTDLFLGQADEKTKSALAPDLLITFGKSVISKNLKLFLRKYKPKAHWHIQPAGAAADTFQNLTRVIHTTPVSFLNWLATVLSTPNPAYAQRWETEEHKTMQTLGSSFPQKDFGEFELVSFVLKNLPAGCNLHLANSMSVRYGNFIGLTAEQKDTHVFSNRGTSGIDGCTSTTVGHALAGERMNVLITGDLAFFYDRNAFWHNYPLPNLRVIVLNNHGGIIFKMIDGPGSQPEADEYFITHQNLNAQKLCEEFGFGHIKIEGRDTLGEQLQLFFRSDGKTKILELESGVEINKTIFDTVKKKIKNSYE